MRQVFISYHHRNDQAYKEELLRLNNLYRIFIDGSVNTGEIADTLPPQTIRRIIRDNYLGSTTVTILLVGTETWGRKHIDWELKSSMIDGSVNKKSGILVITLPSVDSGFYEAAHQGIKPIVFPEQQNWVRIDTRTEYEQRFPQMPARIVDQLIKLEAKVSVVPWHKVANNPENLRHLIEHTAEGRHDCEYDLSRTMRMRDASTYRV
ncbi:MAG: TIR domain-containing protein [Pseudomonadota bacterium]